MLNVSKMETDFEQKRNQIAAIQILQLNYIKCTVNDRPMDDGLDLFEGFEFSPVQFRPGYFHSMNSIQLAIQIKTDNFFLFDEITIYCMMEISSVNQRHFFYMKARIYSEFIHFLFKRYKRYCVLCTKLPKIHNSVAYTIVENSIILSF